MAILARTREQADDRRKFACESADTMVKWLTLLVGGQDGMVECRAIGVGRHSTTTKHTESILYAADEVGIKRMVKDARELSPRAEGVYWTLNPVMPIVGVGAAGDKHIRARRWLLFDVDPVRAADASSSEAEKDAALKTVSAIAPWLASQGWPNAVEADSGNGYHLLYRIDLPNDETSTALIKRVLETISQRFDTSETKIDRTVYNASRICKLYGTIARKGETSEERPHRISKILDYPGDGVQVVTREQLEAICGLAPATAGPAPSTNGVNGHHNGKCHKGIIARDLGDNPVDAYCTRALEEEISELATAQQGNRNNTLLKTAAALFELCGPDQLDQADVEQRLRETAQQIGLEAREIDRTIKSARDRAKPRDTSHVGKRQKMGVILDPLTGIRERVDDPHRLAREFVRAHHRHADGSTIRFWHDEWYTWDQCWRTKTDREVNGAITRFCKLEFDKHAQKIGKEPIAVGTRLVANVLQALRSIVLIPLQTIPGQPAWIDVEGPSPDGCLATQSGILYLPALSLEPLTPRFFSPNVLSYPFNPDAPEPKEWFAFLQSVWPDDPESIECLQEWFGYLLTTDTRQQKILMMIGPRRSGKGTIANTIKTLIGETNVTAPTLASLANQFGSWSLIGKTVAICTESRLTGRTDSQFIVERLLSISGEDMQSIERKCIGNWSGTLKVRFILQGNELPRLGDYSSALPSRLIVLKLEHSFLGQEDKALAAKIQDEMPSILWWAIAGWERLKRRGCFNQPASGASLLKEFEELSNPVGAFLAEKCELGPELKVAVSDLYKAWCAWCKDGGRDHPGDIQGFGRNLRTALPKLEVFRIGGRNNRERHFRGVRLVDDFNPE